MISRPLVGSIFLFADSITQVAPDSTPRINRFSRRFTSRFLLDSEILIRNAFGFIHLPSDVFKIDSFGNVISMSSSNNALNNQRTDSSVPFLL